MKDNLKDPEDNGFSIFPFYGSRVLVPNSKFAFGSRFVPPQLLDIIKFEWRIFKVNLTAGLRRKKYRKMENMFLNIGCGCWGKEGWINMDCSPEKSVNCLWDARRPFPFKDGSILGIFSEHFLEHLEYTHEVPKFLKECHRVLKVGGNARFIVPDAGKYLQAYAEGGWDKLTAIRLLQDGCVDPYFQHPYTTRMELVNAVFRQGTHHHFAYDGETLCRALERCGFQKVDVKKFGSSNDENLLLDNPVRATESLYVDATKT